jgi:hypothetical protein
MGVSVNFQYDVFLSHSANDKEVVRPLAERLRKDGVKVWFDEWALKPGDSIPAKIEEGLECSRVLLLCMSANVFGSWVLLQPERINAYAQAVIRTLQTDEHRRGCLLEERVLKGDLLYESCMERLEGDEERFVLLAMHQTLVERGVRSPEGERK